MKGNNSNILLILSFCLFANALFAQCAVDKDSEEQPNESKENLKQAEQGRFNIQSDRDFLIEPMFIKHLINRELFEEEKKRAFSDEMNNFYFDLNEVAKRYDGNKRPFNPQSRWGKRSNHAAPARFNPQSR
jgi:hypothetical protein